MHFQITFIILGSAAMILLELLELQTMGTTEEEMVLGFNSTTGGANICELKNFNLAWKIPMNFTCSNGELEPVGVPAIR